MAVWISRERTAVLQLMTSNDSTGPLSGGETSLSVFESNLRLLGCFLLVYFGGVVVVVVVVVLFLLLVSGGKESQLLVLGQKNMWLPPKFCLGRRCRQCSLSR